VAQRGQNDRRRAEEAAAAAAIEATGKAECECTLAASKADSTRLVGAATADAEAARLAAYRDLDPHVLLGLALRDVAGQLPSIGTLNVTPDLLSSALSRLAAGAGAGGTGS
jgi:regulator of protease activity HflC (stomatin/prohibitin superfamily)